MKRIGAASASGKLVTAPRSSGTFGTSGRLKAFTSVRPSVQVFYGDQRAPSLARTVWAYPFLSLLCVIPTC